MGQMKLTTPAASGGAGAASSTITSTVRATGEVMGIIIKTTNPVASADIVIKTSGANAPSYNLLALSGPITDGYYDVLKASRDAAGNELADASGSTALTINHYYVDDTITVTLAQGNDNTVFDVYLFLRE